MRGCKKYNTTIYGIDIETSTISIDCDNSGSFMYSFCVGKLNFETGVYDKVKHGRTYKELDDFLFSLNDDNYLIYIHNFAYEFSFFCNNLKFFRCDYDSCLFMEQNKPLYVKIRNLEFRCSYLLLHKSIESIGASIGLDKLEYNYSEIRTPLTDMSDIEIEYNFRDVEIMLKGVYRLYNNNQFITNVNVIPYTKTGVMRFNCEQNSEVNIHRDYVNRNGEKKSGSSSKLNKFLCGLEKANSIEQLKFWESLFQGGLVYSNPECVTKTIHNVASYDFSSDYPFQMLVRYFPSDFREVKDNKKTVLLNCMQNYSVDNYIHSKPFRTMFNGIITIKNIKAKYNFYPVGTSKIIHEHKILKNMYNCHIINGKIIDLYTSIDMVVTCIDYLTLLLFYDFELVDVIYLETAHRYKRSNEFKMNSVLYNGKAKIEYKKYDKIIENSGSFKIYSDTDIQDDYYRMMINNSVDYYEQLEVSHDLYQSVKSDLNSLYGDNAQHLIHDRVSYNYESREWNKVPESYADYKKAQHKTSYIYGLYVPQYARASILYIAYKFIQNGLDVYYIDTDSIKTKNCTLADKLVSNYNNMQLRLLGKYKKLGFGILEKEYVAEKFNSLGTKSYIKMINGNLSATISGLPKASRIYNKLLEYYGGNYEEMIYNCYHYGVVFSENVTKKLSSVYKYEDFDVNIEGYHAKHVSGVVLKPCAVTMRDFTSKTWKTYAKLISITYGVDFNDICSKIIIDIDDNDNIVVGG